MGGWQIEGNLNYCYQGVKNLINNSSENRILLIALRIVTFFLQLKPRKKMDSKQQQLLYLSAGRTAQVSKRARPSEITGTANHLYLAHSHTKNAAQSSQHSQQVRRSSAVKKQHQIGGVLQSSDSATSSLKQKKQHDTTVLSNKSQQQRKDSMMSQNGRADQVYYYRGSVASGSAQACQERSVLSAGVGGVPDHLQLAWQSSIAKEGALNGSQTIFDHQQDGPPNNDHRSTPIAKNWPGSCGKMTRTRTKLKNSSPMSVGVLSCDGGVSKYHLASKIAQKATLSSGSRLQDLVGKQSPRTKEQAAQSSRDYFDQALPTSLRNPSGKTTVLTPKRSQIQRSGGQSKPGEKSMSSRTLASQASLRNQTEMMKQLTKAGSLRNLNSQPNQASPMTKTSKKKTSAILDKASSGRNQTASHGANVALSTRKLMPQNNTTTTTTTTRNQLHQSTSKTSLIQRHLSNKMLSPVPTSSRQKAQNTVFSLNNNSKPPGKSTSTFDTAFGKKATLQTDNSGIPASAVRPKTQLKQGIGLAKGGVPGASDKSTKEKRPQAPRTASAAGLQLPMDNFMATAGSRQSNNAHKLHSYAKSGMHIHTQSLKSVGGLSKVAGLLQTNSSAASLLIKAPSQQAYNTAYHKTIHSDKIPPKLNIQDRPKTTMLIQLQQHQSQQSLLRDANSRVLSPQEQAHHQHTLTQSTESLARNPSSRLGHNPHNASEHHSTLQTYKHSTQSSHGLLSTMCLAPHGQNLLETDKTASKSSESKKGPFTQARPSTQTIAAKMTHSLSKGKSILGSKSNSVAQSLSQTKLIATKGSSKKLMTRVKNQVAGSQKSALDDPNQVDEVLHQQKTEAYKELQRQCRSLLSQHGASDQVDHQDDGVVNYGEDYEMGRIVELEGDDAEVSGDVAQELLDETAQDPKTNSPGKTSQFVARTMNGRAKTTANLQDMRVAVAAETYQFTQRKNSNDTVVLHAANQWNRDQQKRKSSLATLLNPTGTVSANSRKNKSTKSYGKAKDIGTMKGIGNDSLTNSYMTGYASVTKQPQKQHQQQHLQSSKSAKNVFTSCSLGPKSELRQPEQVNVVERIKIANNENSGHQKILTNRTTEEVHNQIDLKRASSREDDQPYQAQQQIDRSTDQQGLSTPRVEITTYENTQSMRVFGPKQNNIDSVSKPSQAQTDHSLQKLESFKSTLVDFTESMNENQHMLSRLTVEQSRELLSQACSSGDTKTVRRLCSARNIEKGCINLANFRAGSIGMSPLHLACQAGHVDIIELLIRKLGADIDLTNELGETSLHLACKEGQKEAIERLLLARAQTSIQDKLQGNTPLHVLALANHQRLQTVASDTIRQTMTPSQHLTSKQQKQQQTETSNSEHLMTDDFASEPLQPCPRMSLIQLILPFAEESKGIANFNNVLPWELSIDSNVALMLKPVEGGADNMLNMQMRDGEEQAFTLPVTASQIQGQSNNHSSRGAAVSRNPPNYEHMKDQHPASLIKVDPISEKEAAKIFTFFDQQQQLEETKNSRAKQFTFEKSKEDEKDQTTETAAQNGVSLALLHRDSNDPAEVYLTTSSKETVRDRTRYRSSNLRHHLSNTQTQTGSDEVRKHQDFLDEDIERIDQLLQNASLEGGGDDDDYEVQQHQRNRTATAKREKHIDTPVLRPSGVVQKMDKAQSRQAAEESIPSQPQRAITRQGTNQSQSRLYQQQTKTLYLSTKQLTEQPAKIQSKNTSSKPQTTTASKKVTIKLSKVKSAVQNIQNSKNQQQRPLSSAQATSQGKLSARNIYTTTGGDQPLTLPHGGVELRVASTPGAMAPRPSKQLNTTRATQSSQLATKNATLQSRLGPPGSKTALNNQKHHTTATLNSTAPLADLKQKVDRQASLLVEKMHKSVNDDVDGNQIRIGPENFVAHQLLGTGSFGEVFLVERAKDRQLLAMKVLSKRKIKQQNLKKYAITERNVMCVMGEHPFIVELRYAFQTREHLFLISDYCPGGDLSQYLEIEGRFEEGKARLYVQEILLGIEALHKQNIIFRDLKPDNVIIDKSGHAMLTDFGLSRENVRRSEIGAKSFCGSYAYLAPEMLKKNGHGKAVDWYLLGVILFEMVTGLPPYYADDKDQLFKNIMRDTIDMGKVHAETSISPECMDLLSKLLEKDPVRRLGTKLGAFEIRQHPFFRETDWNAVFSKQLEMPEPYLATMAMDIIKSQPYLVAGHPHTVGEVCPRDHRSYLPGWSFVQSQNVGTESQLSSSEKLKLVTPKKNPNYRK